MYSVPLVEIQPDALQVCFENKEGKPGLAKPETVWLRFDKASFSLSVTNRSMVDEAHGLRLIQKMNIPTIYTLQHEGTETFNLVFPSSHSVLKIDKQPNITCICAMPDGLVLGTSNGSLIKFADPPSFNINKFVIQKNAHFADVTHVMSFPSGTVLLTVGLDMLIKIWKNDSLYSDFGDPVRTLKGIHKRRITGCVMIGRGRNIVSCGLDGQIVFWELGSGNAVWKGRRIRNLHDGCTCLCIGSREVEENSSDTDQFFDCDAKVIWCGHESGTVSIWDCSTRLSLGEITTNQDGFGVEKIEALRSAGGVVTGLSNGDVVCYSYNFTKRKADKIWHVNVEQLEDRSATINVKQLKVCGDSSVIVLTDNNFVKLDLKSGKLLDTFVGYDESVSDFYPNNVDQNNGKVIAVGKRGFLSSFRLDNEN